MKKIRVVAAGGCDTDWEDWRGVVWNQGQQIAWTYKFSEQKNAMTQRKLSDFSRSVG